MDGAPYGLPRAAQYDLPIVRHDVDYILSGQLNPLLPGGRKPDSAKNSWIFLCSYSSAAAIIIDWVY